MSRMLPFEPLRNPVPYGLPTKQWVGGSVVGSALGAKLAVGLRLERAIIASGALVIAASSGSTVRRLRERRRRGQRSRLVLGIAANARAVNASGATYARMPSDLYELFGVSPNAPASEIKRAYLRQQKIFHPDVAGDAGTEMSALLNDAYAVLGDTQKRSAYNRQLGSTGPGDIAEDLAPTWKRPVTGASREKRPVWTGVPRSRSLWDRVPEESRGARWAEQQFVYVDEWACIRCYNCCDCAPKSFCIDAVHDRARVFAQWGDSEEDLDWAVLSCPVDCISWVSREELQVLEHITAVKRYEMARQVNPFALALEFRLRQDASKAGLSSAGALGSRTTVGTIHQRIRLVVSGLSGALRQAAWA